jgi:chitinase
MLPDGQSLRRLWRVIVFAAGFCFFSAAVRADLWRTGYYPGWEQTSMAASNIDFSALTHIIHFSVMPKPDGTLDTSANVIPANYSKDIVTQAHAAGLRVLICVGGGGTENLFLRATTNANLAVFINSLTNFMAARGYDGIDVDWEPFPSVDALPYFNLINGLRSALNKFPQPKLLTAAVGAYPSYGDSPTGEYQIYAVLQKELDQINIMTYDLSGPYDGWVTWHNSPLYDGGYRFAASGGLVPSVNGSVNNFINNGVAPGKLGIGLPFYGYVWTGGAGSSASSITQPRQYWTTNPVATAYSYDELMTNHYPSASYHWDTNAGAAYVSITNAKPMNNAFISYDDERACQAKVNYARSHNLGGIMIWELAQDHTAGAPDPLLQAVKQALAAPAPAAVPDEEHDIVLSLAGFPLGSYRVLRNNRVTADDWNILRGTNI